MLLYGLLGCGVSASTVDFDSTRLGSNPSIPAKRIRSLVKWRLQMATDHQVEVRFLQDRPVVSLV